MKLSKKILKVGRDKNMNNKKRASANKVYSLYPTGYAPYTERWRAFERNVFNKKASTKTHLL